MRRPLNSSEVSQGFGENPQLYAQFGLAGHHGTDYVAGVGTPIYAVENGVVKKSGNGITDKYTGGFFAGETTTIIGQYETLYGHQSQRLVSPGQRVTEGQLIGYTGNTGYTTGPHLHFGIRPLQPDLNNGYRGYIDFASVLFATPAPVQSTLQPYQRKVQNSTGVNGRAEPNTTSAIVKEYAQGEILDFAGWIKGQNVNGIDTWFKGKYSETYYWAGAFEDKSTNGLPQIIKEVAPVTPPPVVTPPTPTYTFTKDFDIVTEVRPAAIGNFEPGNFPTSPDKTVIHDFGRQGIDTIGSLINTFTKPGVEVSSHFAVSGKRIVQLVSLADRAYHAGPNGNNFIGIETDPVQDRDTIESTKALLRAIRTKYGKKMQLIEHNQIMNTLCGDDIDLNNYEIDEPVVTPPVIVTPPVVTPVPPTEALSSAARFVARIATQFAAAQVIVKGLCELAKQYDLCNLTSKQEGIAVIIATVLIIFGAQFAHKLNKPWKWPF